MSRQERVPRFMWRLFRFLPPRIAYTLGLGSLAGRAVLLLQTTGRKSGLPRGTPLLYDEIDGVIYVASARGTKADWYRNLEADPNVEVRIGSRRFKCSVDLIVDPVQMANFLELRLERHPKMVGGILRLEGFGPTPTREQLEQYVLTKALVAIHPPESA